MAVIDTHRQHGFGAGLFARPATAIWTLIASFRAWNDTRLTRASLRKLSDRELEDIGLCRGDVEVLRF